MIISVRSLARHAVSAIVALAWAVGPAQAGPINIVLDAPPQETGKTCQSYSLALALSLNPASPIKAETPRELRDLEENIRSRILQVAADPDSPTRENWKTAVEGVTNGKVSLAWRSFSNLDAIMRFVGDKTGITAPSAINVPLAVALVKTPVLLSFTSVDTSSYTKSHIATALGVDLPPATITDDARPGLLLVNSAVKYPGGVKNVCDRNDLSDTDHYQASAGIVKKYTPNRFAGATPYLATWLVTP